MPTYNYFCKACQKTEEHIHRISEDPEIPCPDCKKNMERIFTPNIGGFILKGGSPAIHYREKQQRMKKREELTKKQSTKSGPSIQPNVAGMEVDSWKDAQKVAKEAGMNTDSYQPWVDKEKSKQIVV
jgi:putative FmdB family regulatory protein